MGLMTWNRKRRARKEKSPGKAATVTITAESSAVGDQKRTGTTMSGALPSEMHDSSDERGGSGTGPLANWLKKHTLRWRQGRKNQGARDEESNGGLTVSLTTERETLKA